jgi:hypothetical protein
MTIDEARANTGKQVIYSTHPGEAEAGVISWTGSLYVYVRYGQQEFPKATRPECLTLMRGGSLREHIRLNMLDAGFDELVD